MDFLTGVRDVFTLSIQPQGENSNSSQLASSALVVVPVGRAFGTSMTPKTQGIRPNQWKKVSSSSSSSKREVS